MGWHRPMPVRPATPRARRISMTSLIDVIFLLLLFFMLSSTFTRFGEVPLSGAGMGEGRSTEAPVFIRLGAEDLLLNGTSVSVGELPDRLGQLEGARTVLVATSRGDVTSQRLVDLLVVLQGIPGIAVEVLR